MCCWESLLIIWDSTIHIVFVLQLKKIKSKFSFALVVLWLCFGLGFVLIYKWVIFWFGHDAPFKMIICLLFMLVYFLWFFSILKLDKLWFEDTIWHIWHITPKAPSFNTIWWLVSPRLPPNIRHNAPGFNEGLHSFDNWVLGMYWVCRLWV